MKRQKIKKALLRLSCLACALMTLCTFLILPTAAAPNITQDHFYFKIYDGMSSSLIKGNVEDQYSSLSGYWKGAVYLNGELVYDGYLTMFVTKEEVGYTRVCFTADDDAETLLFLYFDGESKGGAGLFCASYYDGVQSMPAVLDYQNAYQDVCFEVYAIPEGPDVEHQREQFSTALPCEWIDYGSMSYLVSNIFGGFGAAIGGSAGGVKTAFNSLIYANGQSGAFSPLVIFLFSMLGLALAAGIAYKIFSMIRNRR